MKIGYPFLIDFMSLPTPFGGRSAASSGPRWTDGFKEGGSLRDCSHASVAMASPRSDHDVDMGALHEKGVKGVLPVGCLPLWGREGVTLASVKHETDNHKRISREPQFYKKFRLLFRLALP
jgi:hypothetical protein